MVTSLFFVLCGAARAQGDLAQKGLNNRVLTRNCRQMAFVVHLKGLQTLTIRHLDLLHVKSMQTLSTCSRILFSLFLVCSSMCFIVGVHWYTNCNVKRTREASDRYWKAWYDIHHWEHIRSYSKFWTRTTELIQYIHRNLSNYDDRPLHLGGDFNLYLNPRLDKLDS